MITKSLIRPNVSQSPWFAREMQANTPRRRIGAELSSLVCRNLGAGGCCRRGSLLGGLGGGGGLAAALRFRRSGGGFTPPFRPPSGPHRTHWGPVLQKPRRCVPV